MMLKNNESSCWSIDNVWPVLALVKPNMHLKWILAGHGLYGLK